MKRIEAFQTSDGVVHKTHNAAKLHAEERYGEQLTGHAHKLCRLDSYSSTLAYLDSNADVLAQLSALKADRDVVEGGE